MHPPFESDLSEVSLFYHPTYLEHDAGADHPESPDRLRAILAALRNRGYADSDLKRPDPADGSLLAEVHDPHYVSAIEAMSRRGGAYWDLDTHVSANSYNAALLGVGAAVAAVDNVMSGKGPAFALVRPPGHHALESSAMGFCLFNNVAVAAHHATREYGLDRVLVVDWDVHHGNGTQDLLYNRPDVLFFSTHQYPFYPGTGAVSETGEGRGEGYTVNVPLSAGLDDAGYVRVFRELLVPVARRYKPQLILISAGYDAHIGDPIGGMALTVAGFGELARLVKGLADELCEGRVAAVLEGGYNPGALAQSVLLTIGMLGEKQSVEEERPVPPTPPLIQRRKPDVEPLIGTIRNVHGL